MFLGKLIDCNLHCSSFSKFQNIQGKKISGSTWKEYYVYFSNNLARCITYIALGDSLTLVNHVWLRKQQFGHTYVHDDTTALNAGVPFYYTNVYLYW